MIFYSLLTNNPLANFIVYYILVKLYYLTI
jgi:hypothetical protein